MRLTIRGQRVHLSAETKSHIVRHVHFALSRFSDRVQSVDVWLLDCNGPRGGVDKVCRMRVTLRSANSIHLEDVEVTFEAAVDRACDRVGRRVAQILKRQQEFSRVESLRRRETSLVQTSPGFWKT